MMDPARHFVARPELPSELGASSFATADWPDAGLAAVVAFVKHRMARAAQTGAHGALA